MDLEVKWSPEATEDIEAIGDHIARNSEYYAQAVVTELLLVARNVGEFPMIGGMVPEIGDENIAERYEDST
jgi:toxin ParE1/3/4